MRTRSTVTGSLTSDTNRVYNGVGSLIYTTYSGKRTEKVITDLEIPNFHALKKCGKFLPLNPVDIKLTEEVRVPGVVSITDTNPSASRSGTYWEAGAWNIGPAEYDEDLLAQAVLTAASKAASGRWDVLTALAELRQTVHLMKQLGGAFNQATARMARAAVQFRRNPWEKFRELWLTGRYGVRPIVYDFQNAADALANLSEKVQRCIGRSTIPTQPDGQFDSGWIGYATTLDYRRQITRRAEVVHRGWASCAVSLGVNTPLQVNPLVTAWELIPYSFVVDWLIDIGSYVDTLQPQLAGDYEGIASSWKVKETLEMVVNYRGKGSSSGSWGDIKTIRTREQYVRSATSIPFPPLLGFARLDLWKVVDLAALFITGQRRVHQILSQRR